MTMFMAISSAALTAQDTGISEIFCTIFSHVFLHRHLIREMGISESPWEATIGPVWTAKCTCPASPSCFKVRDLSTPPWVPPFAIPTASYLHGLWSTNIWPGLLHYLVMFTTGQAIEESRIQPILPDGGRSGEWDRTKVARPPSTAHREHDQ